MTRAYLGSALVGQRIAQPVEVLKKDWLQYGDDPPRIELTLSDGSYLLVGYDWDYHAADILRAADKHADYESIPARESGLGDALEPYIDEAKSAAESHARQQDDDSGADADYAMDSAEARR